MMKYVLYIFVATLSLANALFEDQVGKFEWRQQYIGNVIHSHVDILSPTKKLIVATEKNVVAALSLKSGDIVWRQLLEDGDEGLIMAMSVNSEIVTISGTKNTVVRGWDLENGHLLWEWVPKPNISPGFWIIDDENIAHITPGSPEIRVTWYRLRTGERLRTEQRVVDGVHRDSCVVVQGEYLTCFFRDALSVVTAKGVGDVRVMFQNVESPNGAVLKAVEGAFPAVSLTGGGQRIVIGLKPEISIIPVSTPLHSLVASASVDKQNLVFALDKNDEVVTVETYTAEGEKRPDLKSTISWPKETGLPERLDAVCQARRDGSLACRLVVSCVEHSLVMVQHPESSHPILWKREEALASVLTADLVELPLSDAEAAMDNEFKVGGKIKILPNHESDRIIVLTPPECDHMSTISSEKFIAKVTNHHTILSGHLWQLGQRLSSQWQQLYSLLLTVLGIEGRESTGPQGLQRDDFGLHKVIVAVTQPGKVFGIDNLTGKIVWRIIADVEPLIAAGSPTYPLYILRSPIHPPLPGQAVVIGRSSLLVFDPITGELAESLRRLPYAIRQAAPLQVTDENHLRPLVLLDYADNVHVYPESAVRVAASSADSTFLYTIETATGWMSGYRLKAQGNSGLLAVRSWQLFLGQDDAKIVAVAPKRDPERVHSQGRVLGDRSVLYKYVNPNLVAIITQGYHPSHKSVVNVYLVDVVSGLIVTTSSQRRAREPVHIVHAENWVVYSWMSEKNRRTEIATLEMYEGPVQSNATTFSSFTTPPLLPMVERQAYILPNNIKALRDTVTEKGITSKHILVALANGGILELPWAYVDPRRTMIVTQEMREEGIVPYMPELPIPMEAIINHNQSLAGVRNLVASPSGLESTSLIFVFGLDLFYSRVSPSKTFDLLKEDFDYFLITAVLTGLAVSSLLTRRLASRKALKQAWK